LRGISCAADERAAARCHPLHHPFVRNFILEFILRTFWILVRYQILVMNEQLLFNYTFVKVVFLNLF
jgi:hypothetical protein